METNEMNTLTRAEEILQIIQSGKTDEEIRDALDDYHENDIAEALQDKLPVVTIGDAQKTARILEAVRSGYLAGIHA